MRSTTERKDRHYVTRRAMHCDDAVDPTSVLDKYNVNYTRVVKDQAADDAEWIIVRVDEISEVKAIAQLLPDMVCTNVVIRTHDFSSSAVNMHDWPTLTRDQEAKIAPAVDQMVRFVEERKDVHLVFPAFIKQKKLAIIVIVEECGFRPPQSEALPDTCQGFTVMCVEGTVTLCAKPGLRGYTEQQEVLTPGLSIGRYQARDGAGTLSMTLSSRTRDRFALSNAHVLTSETFNSLSKIQVAQPAFEDLEPEDEANHNNHVIGTVVAADRVNVSCFPWFDVQGHPIDVGVDIAVIRLQSSDRATVNNPYTRKNSPVRLADDLVLHCGTQGSRVEHGETVYKNGRTSGVTLGRVMTYRSHADCVSDVKPSNRGEVLGDHTNNDEKYSFTHNVLKNQILVISSRTAFVDKGDSGAMVFRKDGSLVGLLHSRVICSCVGVTIGLVSPIEAVKEFTKHFRLRW